MPVQKRIALTSSRERLREAAKTLFAERGYEATSTAAIARAAGTSQSQLIKHFVSKQGILEAIFQYAWEQINPAIQLATESVRSPLDKFRILVDMVLSFLERDKALRTLFLLEGRRIRDDGHMTVLVPGFLEFVKIVDGTLKEISAQGLLAPGVHPQAMRSALMGCVEGLLRDQLLARTSKFPAAYGDQETRALLATLLSAFLRNPEAEGAAGD